MRNSTSFVPVTWLQVFRFENSLYIDVEFHPVYRRKKAFLPKGAGRPHRMFLNLRVHELSHSQRKFLKQTNRYPKHREAE